MSRVQFIKNQALLIVILVAACGCGAGDGGVSELSDRVVPGECARETTDLAMTASGGCLQVPAGLVWSAGLKGVRLSYKASFDYCDALVEAGYEDWRLPGRDELVTLGGDQALLAHFKFGRINEFFWADSGDDALSSWAVLVASAEMASADEMGDKKATAVCVRKPLDVDGDGIPDSLDRCNWPNKKDFSGYGSGRRYDDSDRKGCTPGEQKVTAAEARQAMCAKESNYFATTQGGCRHKRSGIIWSPVASTPRNYEEAGRYCSQLIVGPWSNWRIPSAAELHQIATPELAVAHFTGGETATYWTTDNYYTESYRNPYGNYSRGSAYRVVVDLGSGSKRALLWYSKEERTRTTHTEPFRNIRPGPAASARLAVRCLRH